MRILAATRQSVTAENSVSPEYQAEDLREYAHRNGHTIVAETTDLDVSGGKPIRSRPGVGAWLTPEHLDEWDAIAGYSIDRMFRNLYDFVTFWHDFLKPNGKSIIITSENIDMSTPDGVMMAQLRVIMAENELNKISQKNKRAAKWTREAGLWKGGQIPWGYAPVEHEYHGAPHWILAPHPELKDLINQMADELIAETASRAEWCRELSRLKIPTGRYHKDGTPRTLWKVGPLTLLLRKETLMGYITYNHRLVDRDGKKVVTYDLLRTADGTPMRREPILSDAKWAALQDAIKHNPGKANGKRRDAAPLLHIARCAKCGSLMHHHGFKSIKRNKTYDYRYYFCYNQDACKEKSIAADELETWVDEWVTQGPFANMEMIEHIVTPGNDHKEELERNKFLLNNLDPDADDYDDQHAALRQERKYLLALPTTPPITEDRPAGMRLADYWQMLDQAQRRAHLLRAGITVHARRNPDMGDPLDIWVEGNPTKVVGALIRKAK